MEKGVSIFGKVYYTSDVDKGGSQHTQEEDVCLPADC